ncbi:hypothetical protein [Desulfuromonas thiophila]|uniref:hypothetical protein n=1 Tax=Desulfuromonas thiophila TaxID=57664 RepID=UPI0024A98650|nr:hypothetical protein [Desulfuromonas thiophila]
MAVDLQQRQQHWQQLIDQLRGEWARLPETERDWLRCQSQAIAVLQHQLHALFLAADGPARCQACAGSCCDSGHNHLTLINAVAALQAAALPEADFQRPCPFIGPAGCLLAVDWRPFNCIIFLCEPIEQALPPQQQRHFYQLEGALRDLYLQVEQRYQGGSRQGLLIGGGQHGRALLQRR